MGATLDAIANSDHAGRSGEAALPAGTRFLVFPQPPFVPGYDKPELVWIGGSAGRILAGPSDDRMYVIDPVEVKRPYGIPYLPPFSGLRRAPAEPGPDGHFDHISVTSPAFLSAHSYACSRRVLDICEGYAGKRIDWFFSSAYERLEIVPHIPDWENAQSGFGFLELGESRRQSPAVCFALNFDAVAHEMGHLVLLGELGMPDEAAEDLDFFAYHEAIADFISLLGLMHFDTALDRLLRRTGGNLLIHNELDRFAELSDEKQIRSLNNSLRVEDVGDDVHDRSKPFAAALFDSLVEIYQTLLFQRGITDLDPRRYGSLRHEMAAGMIERGLRTPRDYEIRHFAAKAALQEARDIVGEALVGSWSRLDPNHLTFRRAADAFLDLSHEGRARPYLRQIEDCFRWRQLW